MEQEQIQRKRKASLSEPKPKRRRQSIAGPSGEVESSVESSSAPPSESTSDDVELTSPSEATNGSVQSENDSDHAMQKEDVADEVLKEYKRMRDKEKKSPEMKIEVCESCGVRDPALRSLPCTKCRTVYHPVCLGKAPDASELLCPLCDLGTSEPDCIICHQPGGDEKLMACKMEPCSRRYHRQCLANFNSLIAKQDPAKFICPAHHCHTCVADLGVAPGKPDKKQALLHCIQCPTAFHSSQFLTYPFVSIVFNTLSCIR